MKLSDFTQKIKKTLQIPGDEDGAEVDIRLLTSGEEAEAIDAAVEGMNSAGELRLSQVKMGRARFCKMVTGYRGITGEDGEPLKYNLQNTLRLYGEVAGFRDWIFEEYRELEAQDKRRKIELEKNSGSSDSGSRDPDAPPASSAA